MNFEKDLPIILIVGTISLYLLLTGIIGLLRKRMSVLNPMADTRPLTVFDGVISILKKKAEADYYVPEGFIDRSPKMNLAGKKALVRAWLHIILGLIALFILMVFLYPAIIDKILHLFD